MSEKVCLLVDDDPIISLVHKDVILSVDPKVEVITAMTGEGALLKLRNGIKPDFIFLDINMPLMNGFGLLDNLLENSSIIEDSTKVVLLTSSVNPRDIERANSYDCVIDFISKPLTRAYLITLFSDK